MLHNEHMKLGKDLQRRIAKLREENKDPALPQKPIRPSSKSVNTSSPSGSGAVLPPPQPVPSPPPQSRSAGLSESQQTVDESFMLLGQRVCMTLMCLAIYHRPGERVVVTDTCEIPKSRMSLSYPRAAGYTFIFVYSNWKAIRY